MADLKITHVHLGVENKREVFDALLSQLALSPNEVAYVGDDVIDLPVMRRVGLAIAVKDADPFVKRYAHWHTPNPGGHGAVRDVCELLLEARGQLETEREKYL
jgi:3-deoxy-D-manno-octulosonate 8-phosphate phosphatase (KDO 8-P phosphatase)